MRIAQWDILRFSVDPGHVSPEFPAGYWPAGDAPPDPSSEMNETSSGLDWLAGELGGKFSVTSHPGKGTVLSAEIPLLVEAATA